MTDKVQKIREEVERLYNQSLADENRQSGRGLERAANVSYGKSRACDELIYFIDSLQEEPISEDLEEAIKVCSEKAMLHKAYTRSPIFSEEDYAKGFVDGKDWQKQQLMKQAIEVQVNPLLGETVVGCKVSGYEVGEKVKIIIIKEGEKC